MIDENLVLTPDKMSLALLKEYNQVVLEKIQEATLPKFDPYKTSLFTRSDLSADLMNAEKLAQITGGVSYSYVDKLTELK